MTADRAVPPGQGAERLTDKLLAGTAPADETDALLECVGRTLGRRLEAEPESVERGLTLLVLTVVELFRQAAEREALLRVDDLPEEQVDRMGRTLMLMDRRVAELCEAFGIARSDVTRGLAHLARLV